ncbi:hypothetical protein DPMN_098631 [Dreissena polymorpha]|uniref:Uncharacterized protein n=1 Tax=Dreissena polymorpha TaxID=45954 RepID=A0A9D4R5N6_DREPO|nr:hypothetical protein DPMN_098631 [Dreissena polymorpha]
MIVDNEEYLQRALALLRKSFALSLLPVEKIRPAFDTLRTKSDTDATDRYFNYLERTWMTNPLWPIDKAKLLNTHLRRHQNKQTLQRYNERSITTSQLLDLCSAMYGPVYIVVVAVVVVGTSSDKAFGLCECAVKWGAQQVHGAESSLNHSNAWWYDTHQLDE